MLESCAHFSQGTWFIFVSFDRQFNFYTRLAVSSLMFDIKTKPADWHIEPPHDEEEYYKFVLTMDFQTDMDYRVLDCSAKLVFKRRGGEKTLDLPCSPLRKYIGPLDKNLEFFGELSLENYNDLESLRMGGHLLVKLSVDELFLIPFRKPGKGRRETSQSAVEIFQSNYREDYEPILIKYDTENLNDSELLIVQDDWVEKVIKPLGMGDRLVVEIPIKLPNILEGSIIEPSINDLKEKLEKGIRELKEAIDEYNRGRDAEKCIVKIRAAGDHLYEPPNKRTYKINFEYGSEVDKQRLQSYSEYLIENTDTGSREISKEIMTGIQIIVNQIYDMASKVPHTRTRRREAFEYEPSTEDADMMLGIISLIYYWISIKFKKSIEE